ncbi:MAG: 50S ribosomal protein L13 [Verrucomicrobia bacterium]|nr:50S ribosomal protein L13 [Verrucomicrobiota bacterium]MCH8512097.1 50S ribosomal protein L13 [Kiritimatiellia bacterium]
MKTTFLKESEIDRNWHVVDAAGKPLGRLAAEVATVLRGKHKPTFAPHVDNGDFVIVLNAEKVHLSGNKEEQKIYKHYTGYTNGLKEHTAAFIRERKPERMIRQAVWGMIPRTRQGRQVIRRLKVYAGSEHQHQAQQPQALEI